MNTHVLDRMDSNYSCAHVLDQLVAPQLLMYPAKWTHRYSCTQTNGYASTYELV